MLLSRQNFILLPYHVSVFTHFNLMILSGCTLSFFYCFCLTRSFLQLSDILVCFNEVLAQNHIFFLLLNKQSCTLFSEYCLFGQLV